MNEYQPTGQLGSQDPLLPIDLKDIEAKILGPDDQLRKLWKKRTSTIGRRNKERLGNHSPQSSALLVRYLELGCLVTDAHPALHLGRI